MTAALIDGPALEPVSLEDAKAHLRVGHETDDGLIAAAITAARVHVETAMRRLLIEQAWRIYFDEWPASGVVPLRLGPLISVDAVTVYDAEGELVAVPAEDYELDLVSQPGRLVLKAGATRPGKAVNGIEIDVTAGYGATSVDVPAPLRQAILMLVAHWYEHRAAAAFDQAAAVAPLGFEALVAPYRVLSL